MNKKEVITFLKELSENDDLYESLCAMYPDIMKEFKDKMLKLLSNNKVNKYVICGTGHRPRQTLGI